MESKTYFSRGAELHQCNPTRVTQGVRFQFSVSRAWEQNIPKEAALVNFSAARKRDQGPIDSLR